MLRGGKAAEGKRKAADGGWTPSLTTLSAEMRQAARPAKLSALPVCVCISVGVSASEWNLSSAACDTVIIPKGLLTTLRAVSLSMQLSPHLHTHSLTDGGSAAEGGATRGRATAQNRRQLASAVLPHCRLECRTRYSGDGAVGQGPILQPASTA